jgi:hypothetical protein
MLYIEYFQRSPALALYEKENEEKPVILTTFFSDKDPDAKKDPEKKKIKILLADSCPFFSDPIQIELDDGEKYVYSGGISFQEHKDGAILGEIWYPIVAKKMRNGEEIDPTLYPVAFVRDNRIILNWELADNAEELNQKIVDYVMEKAVDHFDFDMLYPDLSEHFCEELLKFYSVSLSANRTRLENIESSRKNSLANYLNYCQTETRLLQERQILEKTIKEKKRETKNIKKYLDNHRKIFKYEFEDGVLTLRLEPLEMVYGQDTIIIPPLKVMIPVSNGNLEAHLDKSRLTSAFWGKYRDVLVGMDFFHPHVNSNGSVCLGNFSEIFAKIIASGEIRTLVELIVEFFRTFNENSPYLRWDYFYERLPHELETNKKI